MRRATAKHSLLRSVAVEVTEAAGVLGRGGGGLHAATCAPSTLRPGGAVASTSTTLGVATLAAAARRQAAARWAAQQQRQAALLARLASSAGASTSGRAPVAAAGAAASHFRALHAAARSGGGGWAGCFASAGGSRRGGARRGYSQQQQGRAATPPWRQRQLHQQQPQGDWYAWLAESPSARLLTFYGYNARVAIINALYTMQVCRPIPARSSLMGSGASRRPGAAVLAEAPGHPRVRGWLRGGAASATPLGLLPHPRPRPPPPPPPAAALEQDAVRAGR